MNAQPHLRREQSGVMLIEALVAILIFSLGILTVISLQTTSIRLTDDARMRTTATLLANRLIGQMWVNGNTVADIKTNFENGGGAYNTWLAAVTDLNGGLPGVVGASGEVVSTLPVVTVDSTAGATSGQVVITLFWRTPSMPLDQPGHRHIVTTQISRNP